MLISVMAEACYIIVWRLERIDTVIKSNTQPYAKELTNLSWLIMRSTKYQTDRESFGMVLTIS